MVLTVKMLDAVRDKRCRNFRSEIIECRRLGVFADVLIGSSYHSVIEGRKCVLFLHE